MLAGKEKQNIERSVFDLSKKTRGSFPLIMGCGDADPERPLPPVVILAYGVPPPREIPVNF